MAPIDVVVAGSTIADAHWFVGALELPAAVCVSPGMAAVPSLHVSAVILTPSFALAASGALGTEKAAGALRIYRQLVVALRKTGPGNRVRATTLHEHLTADTSWGDGFYSIVMPSFFEGEGDFTAQTATKDAPVSFFVAPAGTPPHTGTDFKRVSGITNLTLKYGPGSIDPEQIARAIGRADGRAA